MIDTNPYEIEAVARKLIFENPGWNLLSKGAREELILNEIEQRRSRREAEIQRIIKALSERLPHTLGVKK